jgi:hypothetical protein
VTRDEDHIITAIATIVAITTPALGKRLRSAKTSAASVTLGVNPNLKEK